MSERTSRAAVLCAVADPLLLNLWHKCYIKNMAGSLDQLYVRATNAMDPEAKEYIIKKYEDSGIKIFWVDWPEVHGDVLKFLLDQVQEETVILFEDDFFVTAPGVLDSLYEAIESNKVDCIGSTRACCSTKVVDAITRAFNLSGSSPEHQISSCPNFWPCLFAAKTETLLKTDGHYAAKAWEAGETIPYINMVCDTTECGDSFVWASIQLRGQGNRFAYVHQYHTGPDDLRYFPTKTGLYANNPIPWVHVGSLSTGVAGLIRYDNGVCLNNGSPDGKPSTLPKLDPTTVIEFSRRLAMFKFIADYGRLEDPELEYFNEIYSKGVDSAIQEMGVPMDTVMKFYEMMQYIFALTLED